MEQGYIGVVKNLAKHSDGQSRGFGFVQVEGFDQNIFFHAQDLRRVRIEDLRLGDKLHIETVSPNDRPNREGKIVSGLIAKEIHLIM
jgi:cold shock CspA family protein